jgi:hypothetical protein
MSTPEVPARLIPESRALTAAQFQGLTEVPPELEWFANIPNEKTRRAYQLDITDFSAFVGIQRPEEFRLIPRAHVIDGDSCRRTDLERRQLSPSTIRCKLSALSSRFEYLCEHNAVTHNPVKGVKHPRANHNEGTTPAVSDAQARALFKAPPADTQKGVRDRAILATLLFHGICDEELCELGLLSASGRVNDDFKREGLNVSVAIFLRSDIFDKMTAIAREPDKILDSRLLWQDPELLLRVIEERFLASHAGSLQPDELWQRYFCPFVKGVPARKYILDHILPRPGDLVFFINAAVATAINRKHTFVQEADIFAAEKQYSQYAIEAISVEDGVTVSTLENVFYEFVGSNSCLTYHEVKECLSRASVPHENIRHFQYLL